MDATAQLPHPRAGKELIDASKPFAKEDPRKSWVACVTTWLVIAASMVTAGLASLPMGLRLLFATVAGLAIVRGFILYHDHMHGALLRRSPIAKPLFWAYGIFVLTPPRVWVETHNYHHAHTAKLIGSNIGSYPTLTVGLYKKLTWRQKLMYRAARHPLTVLFGYVTIFLLGMCIAPLLRAPRKHWDSAVALVCHALLLGGVAYAFGVEAMLMGVLLPLMIAMAAGSYLFYAQHNFEGMQIRGRHEWTFTGASLDSSSYMKTGPIMQWFTGSIGFHHVHHLNPFIPFYRLKEAMDAIPELQHPGETSLSPTEIYRCFRLALWDPEQHKMVRYSEI